MTAKKSTAAKPKARPVAKPKAKSEVEKIVVVDEEIVTPDAPKEPSTEDPTPESSEDPTRNPGPPPGLQEKINAFLRKPNRDNVVQKTKNGPYVSAKTGVAYVPVTLLQ